MPGEGEAKEAFLPTGNSGVTFQCKAAIHNPRGTNQKQKPCQIEFETARHRKSDG